MITMILWSNPPPFWNFLGLWPPTPLEFPIPSVVGVWIFSGTTQCLPKVIELTLGIIKSELCRLKLVSDFWKVLPHWKWHFQNFMSLKGNKTVTKNMYITMDYFTYINGNILITNIFVTSRNNVICHCFYKVFTKKRKNKLV